MNKQASASGTTKLQVGLDKDLFLRSVLRELTGTLEDVIGREEASGYISVVGQQIGEWINDEYKQAHGVDTLDLHQVANALLDLKHRIEGGFSIDSVDSDKIVLLNSRCPFGDKVRDRQSLCMMTSNVFGTIAAENLGYASVDLEKTIAAGDQGCRVVIYLKESAEDGSPGAREYFKS